MAEPVVFESKNPLVVMRFFRKFVPTWAAGCNEFRLRPYERATKVVLRDGTATLVVDCYTVRETARKVIFEAKGTKLYQFEQTGHRWIKSDEMTVWDEDWIPVHEVPWGLFSTEQERRAKEAWEADAYRVGSASNPMDNFRRTAAGQTTDAMTRHWS